MFVFVVFVHGPRLSVLLEALPEREVCAHNCLQGLAASHYMKELSKKLFIASCQMTVCLVVLAKTTYMKHNGYR